jgi:hypothetical protein
VPLDKARETLSVTLRQRCFWLFAALLLVVMSVPFLEGTSLGRVALNLINLSVLVAAASAIGRSSGAPVIAILLAAPAAVFQALGLLSDGPGLLILSWCFVAAFYFITISYLLTYALRREVLTMDKLYGAAATFLMLGVLWAYLYNILLWFYPGALAMNGVAMHSAPPSTMVYFSFVTLTATGMSDILPAHPIARMLCAFEMITGVLFIAVLIARLAGSYPPRES